MGIRASGFSSTVAQKSPPPPPSPPNIEEQIIPCLPHPYLFLSTCHHPLHYHHPQKTFSVPAPCHLVCDHTFSTKDSVQYANTTVPPKETHCPVVTLISPKDNWAVCVRRLEDNAYPLFHQKLILIKLRTHARIYLRRCLWQFLMKLETIFLEAGDLGLLVNYTVSKFSYFTWE